jgi:microcystin-dependent protein
MVDGTYTPPVGTFGVTGTVISSTAYNVFVNDAAQALTDSLAKQGETVWTASQNMGSNTIINVAPGVNPTDAANLSQLGQFAPIGSVMIYPSATPPSASYLLCNGQAVSRSTYATLFTLVGTAFGAGDGSTTFNVPNFNSSAPLGITVGSNVIGTAGGAATVALATGNLPAHNHGINDPGHNHAHSDPGHNHGDPGHTHGASQAAHAHTYLETIISGVGASFSGGAQGSQSSQSTSSVAPAIGVNGAVTGIQAAVTNMTNVASGTGITTQNAGSGTAFNIRNPYVIMAYMIRVL